MITSVFVVTATGPVLEKRKFSRRTPTMARSSRMRQINRAPIPLVHPSLHSDVGSFSGHASDNSSGNLLSDDGQRSLQQDVPVGQQKFFSINFPAPSSLIFFSLATSVCFVLLEKNCETGFFFQSLTINIISYAIY